VTNLPVFIKLDYQSRFPFASKEAIDLLDKLLAFNPFFRISVDEALRHEFFKDVHDPSLEVVSSEEIDLEFDH
jgi:serine/threonine protein kinase